MWGQWPLVVWIGFGFSPTTKTAPRISVAEDKTEKACALQGTIFLHPCLSWDLAECPVQSQLMVGCWGEELNWRKKPRSPAESEIPKLDSEVRGISLPVLMRHACSCFACSGMINLTLFIKERGSSGWSRATKEPLGLDFLADDDFSLQRSWCWRDL